MTAALKVLDEAVAATCKWVVIICLIALFGLLAAGVLTRALPFVSIAGYDEIVELLFAWLTFAGAAALWREGSLYRVMIVSLSAPLWVRRPIEVFIRVLMLVFALVLVVKGTEFVAGAGETTPFLRLNKAYWYAAIPVCGALMTVYSVIGLVRLARGHDEAEGGAELLG